MLVTKVMKEITSLRPNSTILLHVFIAVVVNIYNTFIKYIVCYYEIHLKYYQDTMHMDKSNIYFSNRNKNSGQRLMECKQNK